MSPAAARAAMQAAAPAIAARAAQDFAIARASDVPAVESLGNWPDPDLCADR